MTPFLCPFFIRNKFYSKAVCCVQSSLVSICIFTICIFNMLWARNMGVELASTEWINYPTWRVQVRMALLEDGLRGIVNGTEYLPEKRMLKNTCQEESVIALSIEPSLLYLIGIQKTQELFGKNCLTSFRDMGK